VKEDDESVANDPPDANDELVQDDPSAGEDAPPPPAGAMDEKHSGLCPRSALTEAKRRIREEERSRKEGEVAWSVIGAAGRAGDDVAAVIAADENARAEAAAMQRIISRIGDFAVAAVQQPAVDDASDLVDESVDWKGEPRDVMHERPPPASAAVAGPRRSARSRSARPIFSAFQGVDTDDVVFDDDDTSPINSAAAAAPSHKRQRRV
jgi:hypothetical protein